MGAVGFIDDHGHIVHVRRPDDRFYIGGHSVVCGIDDEYGLGMRIFSDRFPDSFRRNAHGYTKFPANFGKYIHRHGSAEYYPADSRLVGIPRYDDPASGIAGAEYHGLNA